MSKDRLKGYHRMPPMPVFDALVKEHGSFAVFRKFFDKKGNPKPNAPEALKREIALARADD